MIKCSHCVLRVGSDDWNEKSLEKTLYSIYSIACALSLLEFLDNVRFPKLIFSMKLLLLKQISILSLQVRAMIH